jgi:hypothetical protein
MNRVLGRVLALERRRKAPPGNDAPRLPPGFWDALAGAVPLERLPAETRAGLAPLFQTSAVADPVGDFIRRTEGDEAVRRFREFEGRQ